MNKKKTVITTEKKEVWVIRNAPDPGEKAADDPGPDSGPELLPPAVDQSTDETPDPNNK